MRNLPLLAARPNIASPAVEWQLVDTLFAQRFSLLIGNLIGATVAVEIWCRGRSPFYLAWGVALIAVLGGRLLLAHVYQSDRLRMSPRTWARWFTLGAWISAAVWGVAGGMGFLDPDPLIRFILATTMAAFIGVAATRNSAAPLAAIGQIVLVMVPLSAGGLTTGDPYYSTFAVINALHAMVTMATVFFFSRRTVDAFVLTSSLENAQRENEHLVEELTRSNRALEGSNAALATLAVTDDLTGLLNRRGFDAALRREGRRGERTHAPLSVLLIDIDHFKVFNDTYGHPAGDKCLRAVGHGIARALIRPGDEVSRYGGEEFAAILPDTDAIGALRVAERVRGAVAAMAIDLTDASTTARGVTVSIGVATMTPDRSFDADTLIEQADQGLYQAKGGGRDCVRVSGAAAPRVEPMGAAELATVFGQTTLPQWNARSATA